MVKFRKLKETDIKNNLLHRWMTYLNKNSPDVLVQEVMDMDSAIRKAKETEEIVLKEKMARREYEMRLMALSDMTSIRNYERREGKAEGKTEVAQKMKLMGFTDEQIQAATGIS
jgi:predicted transposase/invertase (TIGR01784 family)